MPVDRKRILELALENLTGEKNRIEAEIAEIRAQFGSERSSKKAVAQPHKVKKSATSQNKKAKANLKTASSMKKLWEKVRKAGFTNLKEYKASLKQ
ncbi:hypothetical protein HUU05_01050 [candidate division KSB1 bacterium]|nr:hypothetical protein [candidate division KSB1 bacterium]